MRPNERALISIPFSGNSCNMQVETLRKAKWEPADKPGSVVDNHSSGTDVTICLKQPTREPCGPHVMPKHLFLYLVLLQVGFTLPRHVTTRAVRSYRTFSPLPGAVADARRYIFCGTFRRLAPPRYYLAPCPQEPGLSSRHR